MEYVTVPIRIDPENTFSFSFNGYMLAEVTDSDYPLKLYYCTGQDSLILLQSGLDPKNSMRFRGNYHSPEELAGDLWPCGGRRKLFEALGWDFCHPLKHGKITTEFRPKLNRTFETVSRLVDDCSPTSENDWYCGFLRDRPKIREVWDRLNKNRSPSLPPPSLVYTARNNPIYSTFNDLHMEWDASSVDKSQRNNAYFRVTFRGGEKISIVCSYDHGSINSEYEPLNWEDFHNSDLMAIEALEQASGEVKQARHNIKYPPKNNFWQWLKSWWSSRGRN